MLISLKELKKYVDLTDIKPNEIADKLTKAGIEVDEVKQMSNATNLVIGEVIYCEKHPDSDHLHITKVDIGNEVLDIVCGAPNVRKGLKVIVAKAGAILPHGEIKKGMIRGQESNGMLCALNELGVDPKYLKKEQIEGIEELPADAIVGNTDVLGYLGLDDIIFDLDLLANRSDCYALFNVAREVGALFNRKVTITEVEDESNYTEKTFVSNSITDNCKEFGIKIVKGIKITDSPIWLKQVLRSEGIRSINNIVDLSNYIMILTGQPIHIYDLDKLPKPELIVRDDIECSYEALDEKTYEVKKGDLVVISDNKVMCIAGVMGGFNSEVDNSTTNIAIEIANFNHVSIRKTSMRLGLSSDASQRFIKGINKDQIYFVADLIAKYLKEVSVFDKISNLIKYDILNHDQKHIECSLDYINKRLGTTLNFQTIQNTLNALNFNINNIDNNHFIAFVPAYRIDVDGKADLSEEVIRYIGIDQIPSTFPFMNTTVGGKSLLEKKKDTIRSFLSNSGFYEVLTYTLINEKDKNAFNYINKEENYKIINPLTNDHEFIRTNVLSSLLRCLEYNLNHQNKNFGIFELTSIDTLKGQEEHLGVVLTGKKLRQDAISTDLYTYFDAKGILDEILKLFNISDSRIRISRLENSDEFHPSRSAIVMLDGKTLAVLGEIHPSIKKEYGLNKENAVLLEMNLSLLFNTKSANNKFMPISIYPTISRDYAFVISSEISYADLRKEIKKCSSLISKVELFDIYKGTNIKEGFFSLALSVTFEEMNHTLKDNEISEIDKKIRETLNSKFNVELR